MSLRPARGRHWRLTVGLSKFDHAAEVDGKTIAVVRVLTDDAK